MHIFFSVGEPSGDQHAAHLIEELRRRRPGMRLSGFGGPMMQRAGCELLDQVTDAAVMGFFRVLPLIWRFLRLLGEARRFFERERPDAVVLVDFPGFNWWIARKAKAAGIPVYYYMPPQLWAWAPWRIRRVRKYVDHVLCGLPFEYEWYKRRGVRAHFVGHPFFDEAAEYPLDREFCRQWSSDGKRVRTIGLLPGSRTHEVTRNWPLMVKIVRRLHAKHPDVRFLVACYKERFAEMCRAHLHERGLDLPIHCFVGKTPEIIEVADCCLMVSGSVSLELLARKTPAVVIYHLNRLHRTLMRLFLRVEFITLPNLIAGRRVMPEWVISWSPRRDVRAVTATLDGWISDPARYAAAAADLSAVHAAAVRTGATARVADLLLDHLQPALTRAA